MVKIIVAKGANDVIGKDNDLIWHLPADMRFFTQTTKGHIVIMGRRNWDSIPLKYRPLSERINVVITRNKEFRHPDCIVFNTLENAIEFYKSNSDKDIFIIGGGQIYDHTIQHELADEMLVTFIDEQFEGDTWFPKIDDSKWTKSQILRQEKDEKNVYSFSIWNYKRKRGNL